MKLLKFVWLIYDLLFNSLFINGWQQLWKISDNDCHVAHIRVPSFTSHEKESRILQEAPCNKLKPENGKLKTLLKFWVGIKNLNFILRSSLPEVFLWKSVLKIFRKRTRKHPCRSKISIKLQSKFIEIALRHGCSFCKFAAYFSEHIFLRTPMDGCSWSINFYWRINKQS